MPPTSMADEDPNEEIVNDRDVLAEVTLPSTVCESNLLIIIHDACH